MLHHRGAERRSVLVGSSVHNQRIERLWRDMHRCVTGTFYRLFYFLEHNDMLDPINGYHLYALHYVFIPRINEALLHFQESWNNHHIRTERGMTPNQLFVAGSLQLRNSGMDFFNNVPESYGTDEEGVPANDSEGVQIPQTNIRVSAQQLEQLQDHINPLADSSSQTLVASSTFPARTIAVSMTSYVASSPFLQLWKLQSTEKRAKVRCNNAGHGLGKLLNSRLHSVWPLSTY